MQSFICVTCGVGHAPSEVPPERCAICDDERQYVTAAMSALVTYCWSTCSARHFRRVTGSRQSVGGCRTINARGRSGTDSIAAASTSSEKLDSSGDGLASGQSRFTTRARTWPASASTPASAVI